MRVLKAQAKGALSCGATSQVLMTARDTRKYTLITNASDVVIWIAFGVDAVIGQGIGIPAGGAYEMEEPNMWQGAVSAIAASGTGKVAAYQEFY
jgi:hypothetical protein